MTPLVVRVEDTEARSTVQSAYLKSPVRVGRSELNDLQLDYPFVSTWHGVLTFEGPEVTYVDLGSTNGSILGGQRLEKNAPVVLEAGAELHIGSLRLHVSRREVAQAEAKRSRTSTQFALRVADIPATPAPAQGAARAGAPRAEPGVPPTGVRPATPRPLAPPATPRPGEALPEVRRPRPPGQVQAVQGETPAPPRAPAEPPVAEPPRRASGEPTPAVLAALENSAWQLGVLHEALGEARRNMETAMEQALAGLSPADRDQALALLAERFPHAARGAAPPAPASAPASPPAKAPARPETHLAASRQDSGLAEVALRLLRTFGEAYLPASVALDSRETVQGFLGAAAELIETAARSFVELRSGYDEFGREMGIRVARGEGPVASARDARQLLAYLLEPTQGPSRGAELGSAFADLMIHQLALLAGVTEGARDVLARLSPEAILADLEAEGGLALKVKALREGAQWRAFLDRFRELEEEGALNATLFGKSFLRAYTAVGGRALQPAGRPERAGKGRRDDEDDVDDEGPPRQRPSKGTTPRRRS